MLDITGYISLVTLVRHSKYVVDAMMSLVIEDRYPLSDLLILVDNWSASLCARPFRRRLTSRHKYGSQKLYVYLATSSQLSR